MNKNSILKNILSIILIILILPAINAQLPVDDPVGVTPDSFFWGLDKALDQLSLLLTFDKGKKAKMGLEVARERLLEVKVMIEENKLEAAEKAKKEHGKNLLKVKKNIEELEEDDSLEEIEEIIEIEKELEEHDEEIEETFGELEVKIKIKGEITEQQQNLIDSILNSMKGQTGEIKIEIKNKKDRSRVRIKQKTGRSDREIEVDVENIEKRKGIDRQEKAFETIKDAREEIEELKEEIEEIEVNPRVLKLLTEAESKLKNAVEAFDNEKFGEAFGQANAAKNLAKNVLRSLEDKEKEDDDDEEEEDDDEDNNNE
ncbi:hypothetical protein CL621_04890 [archaeon]|nr:hypothetical protein [archaeon]|tara:strand:- start:1424 stop:2368 length:945 start_codon:yes stop_codon:yes gene_type:complete